MTNNINERIKELQEIKLEMDDINKRLDGDRIIFEERLASERKCFEERIANERKRFEQMMDSLRERSINLSEKYTVLSLDTISIRLGDLVKELANLVGIDDKDIGVEVKNDCILDGEYNKSSILSNKIKKYYWNDYWKVILFLNKKYQSFCYQMVFKLNLNDVQNDGKTLLEHCTVTVEHVGFGECYTFININKNIDDLVLNIPISDLIRDSATTWYPVELINQAVGNCVERSNIAVKIRNLIR